MLRAFHAAYRADYDPRLIADFLIKNSQCPRSLMHCAERIDDSLRQLERHYQRREGCHAEIAELCALLDATDVDHVFDGDAHGFLSELIRRNNLLAMSVAEAYHFAPRREPVETPDAEADAELEVSETTVIGMRQSQTQTAIAAQLSVE